MSHSPRPPANAAARRAFTASLRGLALRGLLLLPATAGCASGGPDSAEPSNPGFVFWCGATPCNWEVDEGSVHKVSTWHRHDYAVSFDGPDRTRISQFRDTRFVGCLHFDVTAKIDKDATLTLGVDFNNDGTIDLSQLQPELPWRNVPFTIPTPTAYQGLRYSLLKQGAGTAQVAHVLVSTLDDCPNFPLQLKAGSPCADESVCESGRCLDERCAGDEAVSQPTKSE
jgi:hypothetical protein